MLAGGNGDKARSMTRHREGYPGSARRPADGHGGNGRRHPNSNGMHEHEAKADDVGVEMSGQSLRSDPRAAGQVLQLELFAITIIVCGCSPRTSTSAPAEEARVALSTRTMRSLQTSQTLETP